MDEVVTHAEVLRWLPADVQREWAAAEHERETALSPELRGWWTAEEVARDGGSFVEVTRFGDRESRFLRGR